MINPKEALKTLIFEMTASRDFGRRCAQIMDIDEEDLIYVNLFVDKLLKEKEE